MNQSDFPKTSHRNLFPFPLLIAALLIQSTASGQTIEERITAILNQMTVSEKILQLNQQGGMNTADNTRLGIPGFLMDDGPHGVRDGMATSFPVGIGMASTWDVDLARRIGVAIGEEFRSKGRHQALGPCLDIDRDPRNGRSPETGGEDPFLCGQITANVVRGIQSTPCIATVKHYNANHRENGRTTNDITASQRVLHEHAGLAFRTAVQQGGAFCVMNAYNLINGQKCAENANLLTTILRTEWGFPYYVVSDWGSIWTTNLAIKAGCDICMGADNYKNDLPALVSNGTVSQSVLDGAVRRVLRTKILAGMLDYQPPGNPGDLNSTAHQLLCREAGRKSLVLLKNQGNILPIDTGTVSRVALIGPSAAICQIDGSGSAYVTPFYTISPKQGIEGLIGAGKVQYAKGCDINSTDTSGYAVALATAAGADYVIYCGGLDPTQEGEGFDRVGSSTSLPGRQQDLINRLAGVNPNLIVTIFSGGICSLGNCINSIRGLIYAFYPGQEGGAALADVLFGFSNPGGKLPVTMPTGDVQLPPWDDNLDNDYGCGYRWYDEVGEIPQFAFGSGLSYTSFGFSNLVITPTSVAPGELVQVSVDVTNTGARTGDEVVQLYISHVSSNVWMPVKQLKGFRRVTLTPGQTTTVTFTVTADELYYYNESTSSYDIEPGVFTARVGGASDNLTLSGDFTILNSTRRPDLLITSVRMVPPYPFPGQKVTFLATVKNQGSAPTNAATPVKLAFSVNGAQVAWFNDTIASIPPAGMALLCANNGPGGSNTWTADSSLGTYPVTATVDPDNTIDECVETNNTATAAVQVYPRPKINLALNKAVAVTSVEGNNPSYDGAYAVDGNMGTRWSSEFTDPQVIIVDLGATYYIDDVVLYWEAAFGSDYSIRISDGSSGWVEVFHETSGDGGMDVIPVGANAQKVMMWGTQRGTVWGYSLWEFEVHGSPATGVADQWRNGIPGKFSLSESFPNPFNPSTTIRYDLPVSSRLRIVVYDVLGREVRSLFDGIAEPGTHSLTFDAMDSASGVYFLRMVANPVAGGKEFSAVRKLLVIR